MPSTYQATTTTAGKGSGTHHPALTASQSGRSHPTFLRSQAHESKSDPGRLPGDDTTAPRYQPPERRVDPVVRAFQHRERKRDLPVDSATLKTNRPAKILACYRNRPPCETLIRQLLRTKLYNSSNACYINAALLGQFWATWAYEGFDPELWGQWRTPLTPVATLVQSSYSH